MIEFRRCPSFGRVTRDAILTEPADMWIVLFVAGEAVFPCSCEVHQLERLVVAFVAGNARMLTCQRESKTGVTESLAEPIHAIVTGQTTRTVGHNVCLNERYIDLTVTVYAGCLVKCLDVGRMAVLTGEPCSIDVLRMAL